VITRPKPLRVLPCLDSHAWTPSIAALRSMVGVNLLSFASASTLVYRALSDEPDAIVIATEDFGTVAWQNDIDLIDVLSSTPTVLLSGRIHALLRKRAASLNIRSVLPLKVTAEQLLAAIQATVAGLAVALEPFGETEDAYTASNRADGIGVAGRLAEHLTGTRDSGLAPDGTWLGEQRDCLAAGYLRTHSEVSCQLDPGETRRIQPDRSRHHRHDAWSGCNLRS
jgi:hypothetical protein